MGILLSPEIQMVEHKVIEPGRIFLARPRGQVHVPHGVRTYQRLKANARVYMRNTLKKSVEGMKKEHSKWPRKISGDFNVTLGKVHQPDGVAKRQTWIIT